MVFLPLFLFGLAPLTGVLAGCGASTNPDPIQIQLAIYTKDCIDVLGASTAPGAYLQLYPCGAGKLSQEWNFVSVPNDVTAVTVVNENSKLCMSVAYPYDTYPGQYIIQAPCDPTNPDMLWRVQNAPKGQAGLQFINVASGECLDDPYGMTDPPDSYHMQQYYCTAGDPGQGWNNNPVQLGDIP
jgi:hypothetical protein